MCRYRSHSATWGIALLTAISLSSHRLSAQVSDASANQYPPSIQEQRVPPATPAQEQPEVLSRGPVHEAFAEPVTMQLQQGLIAPQQPPPNIKEIPPAEKPQGQQFIWIPGYWSWDADRNGYIWVSACWRAAPPKMSWVPGYWAQIPAGWEWVSGYWAPAGVSNIDYLPAPPMIQDVEPVGLQPSPDTIWVPPCMYWSHGQYVRRAGYWLEAQPNWVWVPSHYVMTPRGYIFAEGHWDYSLEQRGVLFAPVYFPDSVYRREVFTFSPGIVIDVGLLRVSLFAYPRYNHYYFGDYYDDIYLRIGIYPWFESRRYHTWYDPVYEHDRWRHHRSEPRWEEHERDEYHRRCDDKELRPAHTFREQESRLSRLPEPQRHAFQVAQPIEAAVTRQKAPLKFERIDTDARQKISAQASAVHTFSDDRNRWESPDGHRQTVQPAGHRLTTPPAEERNHTVTPQPESRTTVMPPAGHRLTTPPAEERSHTVTPQPESKPTVMPSTGHRLTTPPAEERSHTVTPQPESRTTVMPSTGHRLTTPPAEERSHTVTPQPESKPTVMPSTEYRQPTAPALQRKPALIPSRETQEPQSERIQIPNPPVAGRSGKQSFFQKGPPTQPAAETKDNMDVNIH